MDEKPCIHCGAPTAVPAPDAPAVCLACEPELREPG
jgi:hypothetical protein